MINLTLLPQLGKKISTQMCGRQLRLGGDRSLHARGAFKIAHHGSVIETGKIRCADSAAALRANSIVQHAYLGIS